MQMDPPASSVQPYKATDLLNVFLQFLQDKGEKDKAHKCGLCVLFLVAGIFY